MRNIKNKAFTLVELLVVITILAIISVVAYQNFWGAVDKANSGRKISDVSTIETALQQYKADKNYYPPTDMLSSTNLWGYTWSTSANRSNTLDVVYDDQEVESIDSAAGWGLVTASGWALNIWYKWTISQATLWKKYLTKDLYDPELWDIKLTWSNEKMIDYWIWRYVYAIYKKWANASWTSRWNDYNIAYTIKKDWSDIYMSKITWSYDKESCYWTPSDCPETLIWTNYNSILEDWDEQILGSTSTAENQWIPYPVTDFE